MANQDVVMAVWFWSPHSWLVAYAAAHKILASAEMCCNSDLGSLTH